MGKLSKKTKVVQAPFTNGNITVNGKNVVSTYRDRNGTIVSSYNMNDNERKIQDSVQGSLASSLENLFDITDAQRQEWSNQLDAIKAKGIDEINDIYTPMEKNLKNDIASRFGNFDNSIFMDNLNSITDKKAKAVADLGREITATQNNLYNEELANRMATISLLNELNTAINDNTLSFINASNHNSSGNQQVSSNSSGFNAGNALAALGKLALSYYTKGAVS